MARSIVRVGPEAEKRRAYQREYQKSWRNKHPERVKKIKSTFRERHKAKLKAEAAANFQNDKEKHYAQVRKWGAANPVMVMMQHVRARLKRDAKRLDSSLRFHYNVTADQYLALEAAQNGVCAICGQPPTGKRAKRLFVDHDHSNGRPRALLCHACNAGIGYFRENVELFAKAADYLRIFQSKPPSGEPWDVEVIGLLSK